MSLKERLNRLKRDWKEDLVDIIVSFLFVGGTYYYLNFIEASVVDWFLPVIFMLILIYLKLPTKK